MKNNYVYLYIYSNEIRINYNQNNYYIKTKSIEESTIKDISLFKQDLSNVFKTHKINYRIFSDIIVYINLFNSYLEKEYIKTILSEYGFKKIIISDLSSFLDKKTYIINDDKNIWFIKEQIFLRDGDIVNNIKQLQKNNIINKDIYILKYNNEDLINYIRKNNINTYFIYNPKDIIFDKLTK